MEPPVKRTTGRHHGDLPAALRAAAIELISDRGPRGFSLAEAARRAGVSVSAPYKHYVDRDALLADLAVRGYAEQARRFAAAAERARPEARLAAVAAAAVRFALEERPLFDVIFAAGLDKARHREVMAAGSASWDVLLDAALPHARGDAERAGALALDSMALAHGYAVFLREGALGSPEERLGQVETTVAEAVARLVGGGRSQPVP